MTCACVPSTIKVTPEPKDLTALETPGLLEKANRILGALQILLPWPLVLLHPVSYLNLRSSTMGFLPLSRAFGMKSARPSTSRSFGWILCHRRAQEPKRSKENLCLWPWPPKAFGTQRIFRVHVGDPKTCGFPSLQTHFSGHGGFGACTHPMLPSASIKMPGPERKRR